MITRNIIILPPPHVTNVAISWSRQTASKYKTNFVLDGKDFYPHITLYQLALPDKNSSLLTQQIQIIAKHTKSFLAEADKFSTLFGFIFLNFVKNTELISLHEKIVTSCNLIREGEIIPAEAKNLLNPLVPDYIKYSIRTYGSALDMKAFAPHITLSRLQQFDLAVEAKSHLKFQSIFFEVHSVWLASIGIDGTVNKLLKEFPFG